MKSAPSFHWIEQLAHRQLLDYQCNNPGTCFSEPGFKMTVAAAYHLQDAVTRLRVEAGESVIGYKVGCTGPGTKAQFGMDGPIRGTLFEDEVFRNKAVINPNEFCQLAIEGEMAVKVGEDGQIEAAFPVIELHNFVFRAEQKTLSELIANNGPNASVTWLKSNLEDCSIELEPGSIVLTGTALGLYPVKNGDEVTVHIDEQLLVSCTIKQPCTL